MKCSRAAFALVAVCVTALSGCERDTDPTKSATANGALDQLTRAANAGDAKAQLSLGKRFYSGDGVTKDFEAAFNWLNKSAVNGNSDAMFEVSELLRKGEGVAADFKSARSWVLKAAELGNARAQFSYSEYFGWRTSDSEISFSNGKEEEDAASLLAWLTKSADQNFSPAQYTLGELLVKGVETTGSPRKALIPRDQSRGLQLLQAAADVGYWAAELELAVLFQSGIGDIHPDKEKSDAYWRKVSGQSDPTIQREIAIRYNEPTRKAYSKKKKYQGRELSFEESNQVAFEWFQKAALQGEKFAAYFLASMLEEGRGTERNDQKAFEWYRKAAELGDVLAQKQVAFAYLEGVGTPKDYSEAYRWFLAASHSRNRELDEVYQIPRVRNAIGFLHEKGWGVEKDLVLSYAWYNIAAASNLQLAKDNLARVERSLTSDEIREAQALSRDWVPGKGMTRSRSQPGSTQASGSGQDRQSRRLSAGTGFYISIDGNILTNQHVVGRCNELRISGEAKSARLIVSDTKNDLALLKANSIASTYLSFPRSDDLKQGDDVFAFGYPLDGYLPNSGNITTGVISALAGPGNNSSLYQITAPVQPGSSGGPLLDSKARVIGVIVSKADAFTLARATGDIPQNINFAVAGRTIKAFLDGNQVSYRKSNNFLSFAKSSSSIADEARAASVKVECWQ